MSIGRAMAMELIHEGATTRKFLERTPESLYDFAPHPKCMKMGPLASHIADSIGWTVPTIEMDKLVLDSSFKPYSAASTEELLATFDENLAAALAVLKAVDDAAMGETWSLEMNGTVMLSMPRAAVLRNMILNHLVHHRAQLGLYLRLNDIPVPSAYGPSADEKG
jgi:uncharacterized damage-inducible protein DinB